MLISLLFLSINFHYKKFSQIFLIGLQLPVPKQIHISYKNNQFQQKMSIYLIIIIVTLLIASLYSFLIGQNSLTLPSSSSSSPSSFSEWTLNSMHVLFISIFSIQFLAYIPAALFKTEKFYDLTGSLTYISAVLFCGIARISYLQANGRSGGLETKEIIAIGMVLIWAVRLGSYLFMRILKAGQDSRFQKIKQSNFRFLMSWTLQGLWVAITGGAIYTFLLSKRSQNSSNSISFLEILGFVIWLAGLLFEIVADEQKKKFSSLQQNKGKFIQTGLWSYSRHPNYCGEVIVWLGAAIFVYRDLRGLELVSLLSPIFVYFLLTKVSGVPLLEAKADKKWGHLAQYQVYKRTTPIFFPWMKPSQNKTQSQNESNKNKQKQASPQTKWLANQKKKY